MSEQPQKPTNTLGVYDRPSEERFTRVELVAIALSVLWLVIAVFLYGALAPKDGQSGQAAVVPFVLIALAICVPLAMIWVAAFSVRSSQAMRAESQRLQAALTAIRQAYLHDHHNRNAEIDQSVARKLTELVTAQRNIEAVLSRLIAQQEMEIRHMPQAAVPEPDSENQPDLPLEPPAEDATPPLERADFIRALNFPETPEDREGFNALRKALRERYVAQLLRSSQDILTLLSQDGIYMDDLQPDLVPIREWRDFATGRHGRPMATLGGTRDNAALAMAEARMRNDPVFRDVAHHFLRRFDQMFAQFADGATDAEILSLAETRTTRAFLLLGRITGAVG